MAKTTTKKKAKRLARNKNKAVKHTRAQREHFKALQREQRRRAKAMKGRVAKNCG